MSWQDAVERTVSGLGYDLVDANKSAGGLLRVFIDHPAEAALKPTDAEKFITVDDCEKVTRQLQHVLEVDNVAYERLEVSSPGLDRPLKKAADFARFVGEQVELTLKVPFQGRKKYVGELAAAAGDHWRLLLDDGRSTGVKPVKASKTGRAVSAAPGVAGAPALVQGQTQATTKASSGAALPARPNAVAALDFSLDEVRDARLVPVVDFKGRRTASVAEDGASELALPAPGARPNDEIDGGRIQ